jgi:hypothetical protein
MQIHVMRVHDVRVAEHRLQVPPLQTAQALVEEPARRAVPVRQAEGKRVEQQEQEPVRQAVPEPELQQQNPSALRTGNSDA